MQTLKLKMALACAAFGSASFVAAEVAPPATMIKAAASPEQCPIPPAPIPASLKITAPRKPVRLDLPVAPVVETMTYAPPEDLQLALGEIKLLPMKGKVKRVALGTGSVLSATTVEPNLLLIGENVGTTTLLVWNDNTVNNYRVTVVPRELAGVRAKVDALLAGQNGIKVTQVGTDLVLSGLAHKSVLDKLSAALGDTPGVVNNVQEDQGVAFTRSVLFRLHFVEVKRSLLEQVGINWGKDATGPVIGLQGVARNTGIYNPVPLAGPGDNLLDPARNFVTRNGTTGGLFFGLATTIGSRLNLAVTEGDARVLATPELTARSGGKAKLQVGGEVPIPIAGAFGATSVEFKPYGIMFSIEPHIDADDTITAKISTELSQIDPSVSVGNIPGFITRNTSTDISVKPGEMVALSGLINSELSSAVDRMPVLSKIPILGALFRSNDFRNRKTELVVFVETEIISAGDGLAANLRQRGVDAKREFDEKASKARLDAKSELDEKPGKVNRDANGESTDKPKKFVHEWSRR
jgi:pilus assembly protein CpaC